MSILTHRKCTKCGEIKDISEFYKESRGGYRTHCKKCMLTSNKAWRDINAEKMHIKSHQWYIENKANVRIKSRRFYERKKEIILERVRKWANENAERRREIGRNWVRNNLEKTNANWHVYRSRKNGNGGKISVQEWKDLKEKYNYTCLCCRRSEPEIKLTLDHVIPLKLGGKNIIENAQPLCLSCNSSKGAKIKDYR